MNANILLAEFWETKKMALSTKKKYKSFLNRFLKYLADSAGTPVEELDLLKYKQLKYNGKICQYIPLGKKEVEEFLSYIFNNGASPATYNIFLYIIRVFFDFLIDKGLYKENPAREISQAKKVKNKNYDKVLSEKECKAILKQAYLNSVHDFTLLLFCMTTGARPVEVCNMCTHCIREDEVHLKGKKEINRRYLTSGIKETLLEYLKWIKDYPNCKPEKHFFYQDIEKGKPLKTTDINKIIKKYCEQAGICKEVTCYWFRRSYANFLHQRDFTLGEIQTLMDHEYSTSTQHYVDFLKNQDIRGMLENSNVIAAIEEFEKKQIKLVR